VVIAPVLKSLVMMNETVAWVQHTGRLGSRKIVDHDIDLWCFTSEILRKVLIDLFVQIFKRQKKNFLFHSSVFDAVHV
jgi:hypothetical protein